MGEIHVKHVGDHWEVYEAGECIIREACHGDMLRALWRRRGHCTISVSDLMELVGGYTALFGYG